MDHNPEADQRPCPFCQQEPASQFHEGKLVRGRWDSYQAP
jgi:hypothetical protein